MTVIYTIAPPLSIHGNKEFINKIRSHIEQRREYEEHLEQIRNILEALRQTGLTVRLSKCKFLMTEVQFLGFRISRDGIQPGRKKLEVD